MFWKFRKLGIEGVEYIFGVVLLVGNILGFDEICFCVIWVDNGSVYFVNCLI